MCVTYRDRLRDTAYMARKEHKNTDPLQIPNVQRVVLARARPCAPGPRPRGRRAGRESAAATAVRK